MPEQQCPTTKIFQLLGKKWVMLILHALSGGSMRFCQLQEAVGQANSATLSARLKELEQEGILVREVKGQIPPWVEYRLTSKGETLWQALSALEGWAREWEG